MPFVTALVSLAPLLTGIFFVRRCSGYFEIALLALAVFVCQSLLGMVAAGLLGGIGFMSTISMIWGMANSLMGVLFVVGVLSSFISAFAVLACCYFVFVQSDEVMQ
jgi:hypothetical protein